MAGNAPRGARRCNSLQLRSAVRLVGHLECVRHLSVKIHTSIGNNHATALRTAVLGPFVRTCGAGPYAEGSTVHTTLTGAHLVRLLFPTNICKTALGPKLPRSHTRTLHSVGQLLFPLPPRSADISRIRVSQKPLSARVGDGDPARRHRQRRQERVAAVRRRLGGKVPAVLGSSERRAVDTKIFYPPPLGSSTPADAPVEPTPREAREADEEEESARGRRSRHHLLLPQVVGRRRGWRVVVR